MNFDLEKIIIEPITPKYYEENIDLMNKVIEESHFLAREKKLTYDDNLNFIETFFGHQNTIYLIALYNGKVIGHILSLPRFEDLLNHIVSIGYIVHPEYRKKGVSTNLMKILISMLRIKVNIKIMHAEVASDNIASQKLLNKFEFKEYGRLPRGIMTKNKDFVDLVYYYKNLFDE